MAFPYSGNNVIYFLRVGNRLQRIFSASNLLIGVIEEIDIHKIKEPTVLFYGGERSETNELVHSIRQNGLLQPIIVRTRVNFFEIIAGCRRYNACRALGFRKIICHVVELDDKSAFEVSLTENIQRKSLDPIEEARAFKTYVDEYGWGGISDLATKISKSTSYVYKRLSLLELPANLLEGIRISVVSPSTAEELIPVKDINQRHRIAEMILTNHHSSRETRSLVEMSRESQYSFEQASSINAVSSYQDTILGIESKAQRSFDKSVTALKIAMNKIATILEGVEENWIVYEILMQHKNMLNAQIDLLIREKKKLR
jgi:ParB family transcriptional regulator, chromosome partitioning protein